jgi:YVTN family beta-propeller protein
MHRQYAYITAGLILLVTAGLIAEKTRQERKYVLPDRISEGRELLPNGWRLTPTGRHIKLPGDLPLKIIVTADGKLLVNTAGWHDQNLNVIDMKSEKLEQSLDIGKSWGGMSFEPGSGHVFLSTGGTPREGFEEHAADLKHPVPAESLAGALKPIRQLRYAAGRLTLEQPLSIEGVSPDNYFISAVAAKPGVLYALEINLNRIYRLSGENYATQASAATGNRPYSAEFSPDGKTLAVSNWGGGSVSLFDPTTLKERARIETGSHPNEMLWDRNGRLFVANSGANSVSIIENGRVTETIKTSIDPKALIGSTPDALALSHDGNRLYVANADNNDVAVIDIREKNEAKPLGFIPTGWYPTALAISPDDRRLYVGIGKGLGSKANVPVTTDYSATLGYRPFGRLGFYTKNLPPLDAYKPQVDPRQPFDYIPAVLSGLVSVIDVPAPAQLAAYTRQVMGNSPVPDAQIDPAMALTVQRDVFPKIKHVLYIIRENRTYDQVFGDLGIGNSDPTLTLFGKDVTPNGHALARRFVTLDNLYCDGEVSEDGHQWCDAAYATDFTERAWVNWYSQRGEPKPTADLVASPGGYIWDNCRRHGISFRSYGEGHIVESPRDTVPTMDLGRELLGNVATGWPKEAFADRDYKRVDFFIKELHQAEKTGGWPRFMIMSLGENHTEGLMPGTYSPFAHVASNDLGLGKLVEAVSRSKFWRETAIFVIEDDAQNGPDHVDSHRTVGLVISPWVKRNALDSHMYTTSSMVRTIELILGLPPMTQFDQLAKPMYSSFTSSPDVSVIEALPETVDLEARNPKEGPGARASRKLDFSDFDRADPDELNRILWEALKPGSGVPAPVRSARLVWRSAGEPSR